MKELKKWNKITRRAKTIFLMGHKNLDLDALGSCIGAYIMLKKHKKKCYIIIDEEEHERGVEKVLKELNGCIDIIKSNEIEQFLDKKESKNLLIILDTNKKELVQSELALEKISKKLVLDHHELGSTSIENATIIDIVKASSTCEMIAYMIEDEDLEIDPYYATLLLSGIYLDTNNYTLNTSATTFYISCFLINIGASSNKVQYLLKQDIEEYAEEQRLLSSIETINKHIALTKGSPTTTYRRQDLARVADTLLFFNNIEASFVIGKIDEDTIGLSARSLGNYDILNVLEKLGGGGDSCNGGANFKETTIEKVVKELKRILEEEGE